MKKIFFLLLIAIGFSSYAQSFKIGPSVKLIGTHFNPRIINTNMQANQYTFADTLQVRLGVGFQAQYTFKRAWILTSGILFYRQRMGGAQTGFDLIKSTDNKQAFAIIYGVYELPLTLGYKFTIANSNISLSPNIGISTSLNRISILESGMSLNFSQNNFDSVQMLSSDSIQSSEKDIIALNLLAGLGVHIGKRHQINIIYQYGLTPMHTIQYRGSEQTFNPNAFAQREMRYNGSFSMFYLSYTYYFNLGKKNKN